MNTETPHPVHQGKNVKRFREMFGMKQDALAFELGGNWTQKKVSILESKATLEADILEQVAKILNVSPEVIRNFDEETAYNFINNFNDNSVNQGPLNNYNCTFNPIEKIVELYDEKILLYERMLKEKNEIIEKLTNDNKK